MTRPPSLSLTLTLTFQQKRDFLFFFFYDTRLAFCAYPDSRLSDARARTYIHTMDSEQAGRV